MKAAYYNENDSYAAQWLRNLIDSGHIAPGDVDERSIVDVRPADLAGYAQCHFFAGIGGWSYALRLAGWPDDRPVWTGSCPCQPFSAAGAGKAADDERHLWPRWFSLIAERRPAIVLGEQVEAAIGWGWLDAVFADLEGQGYACGSTVLPACGVGAPHIRARTWFVARGVDYAEGGREFGQRPAGEFSLDIDAGETCELADASSGRCDEQCGPLGGEESSWKRRREPDDGGGVDDARDIGRGTGRINHAEHERIVADSNVRLGNAGRPRLQERERDGRFQRGAMESSEGQTAIGRGDPWHCDWLPCTDGKARPVEPGTFPLVDGAAFKLGSGSPFAGKSRAKMLRHYGNLIVPQVAAQFIGAVMESI